MIELPRSGLRVGVVGLTTVETPEASSPGPNLRFLPYNETLPGCVAAARADGAQFIVALTHIGYGDDVALAADPAAADVDLFVGECKGRVLLERPAVGRAKAWSWLPGCTCYTAAGGAPQGSGLRCGAPAAA